MFNMNFIAKIPDVNAATNASASGIMFGPSDGDGFEINSYTSAAMIMGMLMRNENSAARSRFVPVNIAVDIVNPLREKPGTTAIPWARPVKNAEVYVIGWFGSNDLFGLINVVENNNIAVIMNVMGKTFAPIVWSM